MTIFDYILLALWALTTLLTIGSVGKSRQPITPSVAVGVLVINGTLATGLLWTRGVFA